MPKIVSVIIPTNGQNSTLFLDSISTLLNQKYQSWEGIIVKNPNFDAEHLIKMISPSPEKFKIIDAPIDCGVAEARNIGIKNSIGSYIAYLDDDDLWSDEYLKFQVEWIEKTGADLVYSNYHIRTQKYSDLEGKYISHFISIPYNVNPFDRNVLLTESFIHPSTVLHTKEVTDTIKFPDLTQFSEWKFFLKASKMFEFQGVPYTLVTVQRRLDNTNNRTKFGNESIRNYSLILKETEIEIKDEMTRTIRDFIYSELKKEHLQMTKDEVNKLQTLLLKRGFELAYGYLKHLLSINKIDENICEIGHQICNLMGDNSLADDLYFLSKWYKGTEEETYITENFKRERGIWNVLQ
jgi:glycosyltransferase involved in cell wall biosynthesis